MHSLLMLTVCLSKSVKGIYCDVLDSHEAQATLWHKPIVNAATNPLASLLNTPNLVNLYLGDDAKCYFFDFTRGMRGACLQSVSSSETVVGVLI